MPTGPKPELVMGFDSALAGDEAQQEQDPALKQLGAGKRLPDSTAQDVLRKQPESTLFGVLGGWIRRLYRSKTWQRPPPEPGRSRPLGTVAVDGKSLKSSGERAQPELRCERRVLRAQFTGWGPSLLIGQMQVPQGSNEMSTFPAFFNSLLNQYGRLQGWLECLTLDAGFCSAPNAELIVSGGRHYILGLKNNQPTLLAEAKRLLEPRMVAHRGEQADAYTLEKVQGKVVEHELWSSGEMAGWMDFPGLAQVWLVRRQVTAPDGSYECGLRYLISSLPPGRLKKAEKLQQVRQHWSIENRAFWNLDMQLDEDRRRFATCGEALATVGLLRLLHFNLQVLLRDRSLRLRRPANESLRRFIRSVREQLIWLAGYEQGLRQGLKEAGQRGG